MKAQNKINRNAFRDQNISKEELVRRIQLLTEQIHDTFESIIADLRELYKSRT